MEGWGELPELNPELFLFKYCEKSTQRGTASAALRTGMSPLGGDLTHVCCQGLPRVLMSAPRSTSPLFSSLPHADS